MIKSRNLTLESRIARLEKVLNKNVKRKCESFEADLEVSPGRAAAAAKDAASRIARDFANIIGKRVRPDYYNGDEVIDSPMYGWLSIDDVDRALDDPDARFVFHYAIDGSDLSFDVYPSDGTINLISEDGYSVSPDGELFDSDEAGNYASPLSDWRDFDLSMVRDPNDDDYDDDYDDDDYEDDYDDEDDDLDEDYESYSRRHSRRESKIRSRKFSKNEDVYVATLPNGAVANRVQDVLSGFTDTQWHKPDGAIKVLKRMGILDAATNRQYPTADDVAEAIEDCWEDLIGGGNAVAKFFSHTDDGVTHCALTLYPRTGLGNSRGRRVVLKFDWPNT